MSALKKVLGLLLAAYSALAVYRAIDPHLIPPPWFPEWLWHTFGPLLALYGRWPWAGIGLAAVLFVVALLLLLSKANWERIYIGGGSLYTGYIIYSIVTVVGWSGWIDDGGLSGRMAQVASWVGIPPIAPNDWPVWVVATVAVIGGFVVVVLPGVILVGGAILIRAVLDKFRQPTETSLPNQPPD